MTTNINNMQAEQATKSTEVVVQRAEGNLPLEPESESGVENLEMLMDKGEEKHQEAEADKRELEAKRNHARRGAEQLRPQARLNTLSHERAAVDQHIQALANGAAKIRLGLIKRCHGITYALKLCE